MIVIRGQNRSQRIFSSLARKRAPSGRHQGGMALARTFSSSEAKRFSSF
jgi:hypothetical protein